MNQSFPDLRTYIDRLRSSGPDHLLEISEPVPLDFTSTAVTMQLQKQGRTPAVLFQDVKGHSIPIVANLFATREHIAWGIGTQPENLFTHIGEAFDHLIPAKRMESAPVQEIVWEGDKADLGLLPIPRHFTEDAGRYVTAGMVAARDPDTGISNLAYARLQLRGPRLMGASIHSRQHLWDYHRRAEASGKDLAVAVVIGAHPAVMLAAAAKMAIEEDEYDLAGALIGRPLEVCQARTVNVDVPATAEIVIEGRFLATERGPEGPFGEFTGYASQRSSNNVFEVSAITMRHNPIFVDIIPGNSSEHIALGHIAYEAWLDKRMREALPFFIDFHYPASAIHFHAYVRINKTAEGQPQQAAQLLFGLDPNTKLVVVVDEDIDPADEGEVLWTLATHVQADRRVSVLPNTIVSRLDPSSVDGLGAKMLIDATRPSGWEAKRITIPVEAEKQARKLLAL